ncbi:MAG TPA: hypothetical protein VLA19_28825 [Herpetosiphonaceae bacterium]|nr:hypothetical protein [Herpetosiphonaceae bacterium]
MVKNYTVVSAWIIGLEFHTIQAPDEQQYLFYDYCMDTCYGLSVSRDLLHGQPLGDVDFPENTRHSSIGAITAEELAALRSRYGSRSG